MRTQVFLSWFMNIPFANTAQPKVEDGLCVRLTELWAALLRGPGARKNR